MAKPTGGDGRPLFGDDNGGPAEGVAQDRIKAFIERIERLSEEKQAIADDIKEVKSEARGAGFDMGTLNEMLKLRKMDKAERDEREALRDLYGHALGVFE